MKLTGKIFKVAGAHTPLAAGRHVPGAANMRAFLNASKRLGASPESLREAGDAVLAFQQVVKDHAGDRSTFDSMISAKATPEDAMQVYLENKRLAFRAQRNILGVQAAAQLRCMVIQPAEDPSLADVARIEGLADLRRLRADASLVIARWRPKDDAGKVLNVELEPLDEPAEGAEGLMLLKEFCSKPLPQVRSVVQAKEGVAFELAGQGVGSRAAITCIEAYVGYASVPRYRQARNQTGANLAIARVPCENLLLDLMVREDTFDKLAPTALVYSEHLSQYHDQAARRDRDRLRLDESLAFLGAGPAALHTPLLPRYAEMARYVFDRLGWEGDRFYAYRCRVEYPVIPSTTVLRFDIPEAPSG
jgi:hypothetical protein